MKVLSGEDEGFLKFSQRWKYLLLCKWITLLYESHQM